MVTTQIKKIRFPIKDIATRLLNGNLISRTQIHESENGIVTINATYNIAHKIYIYTWIEVLHNGEWIRVISGDSNTLDKLYEEKVNNEYGIKVVKEIVKEEVPEVVEEETIEEPVIEEEIKEPTVEEEKVEEPKMENFNHNNHYDNREFRRYNNNKK